MNLRGLVAVSAPTRASPVCWAPAVFMAFQGAFGSSAEPRSAEQSMGYIWGYNPLQMAEYEWVN